MRLTGTISYYNPNPSNSYGFISTKIPSGAGFIIDKYFFHLSRVVQSEVDESEIQAGLRVEFDVSDRPTKPGRDRAAIDIYIFAKLDSTPVTAAVAEALSGKDMVKS
jgi:cold shock CspA family protein